MLTRRQALKGVGGLAAAVGASGCAAQDPAGHELAKAAKTQARRPPGTLLWHVRIPGETVSLVAADDLVCAGISEGSTSSTGVFAGAYAMHADTGRKAWTQYGDNAASPFAAGPGALFGVAGYAIGALSATDGKILWTAAAGAVNLGLASTWVLVTGGTVCTTAQLGNSVQDFRNVVLALDSGNGRRKWVADFPSIPLGLTCAAGVVYSGSPVPPWKGSGKVVALDADTGERRWRSADLHMVPGEIAATVGIVAVSTSLQSSSPGKYVTVALDSTTGRQLWHADGAADPLTASGGLVYGVTRSLWARDARTGRKIWERSQLPAVLAVTGDTVLALSSNKVQALSAMTGNERWSHTLPVVPIVITTVDDAVYVAGERDPIMGKGGTDIYAFQV